MSKGRLKQEFERLMKARGVGRDLDFTVDSDNAYVSKRTQEIYMGYKVGTENMHARTEEPCVVARLDANQLPVVEPNRPLFPTVNAAVAEAKRFAGQTRDTRYAVFKQTHVFHTPSRATP